MTINGMTKTMSKDQVTLSKLIYFKKRDLDWVEELLRQGVDPNCTEYELIKKELAELESELKEIRRKNNDS